MTQSFDHFLHLLKGENPIIVGLVICLMICAFKFIKGMVQKLSLVIAIGFAYLWFSSPAFQHMLRQLKAMLDVQIHFQ